MLAHHLGSLRLLTGVDGGDDVAMLGPGLRAAAGDVERVEPFDLARDLAQQADEGEAAAEFGDGEVEAHVEHREVVVAFLPDNDVTGIEDLIDLLANRPPTLVRNLTVALLRCALRRPFSGRGFQDDADLEQILGVLDR